MKRLDALVGEWDMQASIDEQPMSKSRTTFAWLEYGCFLAQHAERPDAISPEWEGHSPLPLDTIMGLDYHTRRRSRCSAPTRAAYAASTR